MKLFKSNALWRFNIDKIALLLLGFHIFTLIQAQTFDNIIMYWYNKIAPILGAILI
jgi:hypothetical protein